MRIRLRTLNYLVILDKVRTIQKTNFEQPTDHGQQRLHEYHSSSLNFVRTWAFRSEIPRWCYSIEIQTPIETKLHHTDITLKWQYDINYTIVIYYN